MGDGMMLLLRGAIRHSATAAAKRSGDSRYKIEPRVQVFCHPFKQRLEPRVHLAGRKIPASTMSGKRPFPNHSSSSNLARAVCSDTQHDPVKTSSRLKLRAIDRRCTDNGGPHRRNRGNRAHRDPSNVIDADGTAYRGRHQVGLRRTPAQHSRKEPADLACSLRPLRAVRSIDRRGRLRPFGQNRGPFLEVSQNHPVSPCRGECFLASGHGGAPVDNLVLKLWNESRTNRARIADSSLVGFVHGNIS
jgi:hypothetical protein